MPFKKVVLLAMRIKIAFLIDPLSNMRHSDDTSFAIMHECDRRRHELYFFESRDIFFYNKSVYASLTRCRTDAAKGVLAQKRIIKDLKRLDVLFIRKEPPFNDDYLACTYLLDHLKGHVFILNDPTGIRSNNEKLSALKFLQHTPRTLVGYDILTLQKTLRSKSLNSFVMKPLYDKGGKGICRGSTHDKNLDAKLRGLTHRGQRAVVLQQFIPHEKTGDKRILLLDGVAIGAFTRLPQGKEFRANMALGAIAKPARITSSDKKIIRDLKPYLRENGLFFTGIDILSGYLSEINVTSPAGIPEINAFKKTHLEKRVVNFLESRS
jgi:glutathione synthase